MKHVTLLSSLFFSALTSISFADAPMKDEAIAYYDWTGIYAGLNLGIVKHTMNVTDNEATTFNATIQQASNPDITGGFQLGFRHQLKPVNISGVYGVEFSTNFSNATFAKEYGSPFALYQLSSVNKLKNFSLLQLMGGIAADRTLLFLAAGLSWTDISGSVTNTDGLPFFESFNVGKKAFGTALGGGIEYAFSNKFSARFKLDVITPNCYTTINDTGSHYQISNSIVEGTLGINYKIG